MLTETARLFARLLMPAAAWEDRQRSCPCKLAQVFAAATRTIEKREDEFATNHFWGRKRPPAAPALPAKEPPDPADRPPPESAAPQDG
jgi:hypothetical protein